VVRALARSFLGNAWARIKGFQALVGVPLPDARQEGQAKRMGNCVRLVFKYWEKKVA